VASLTAPVPPTMTMLPGVRRRSSASVAAGMRSRSTNKTGPRRLAAAGPAARASANPDPDTTYTTPTPAWKVEREMAAAVA
jgi:hypothetical protein